MDYMVYTISIPRSDMCFIKVEYMSSDGYWTMCISRWGINITVPFIVLEVKNE